MSVETYTEIVGKLDELEPEEIASLAGEIQARMAPTKKYRLEDFFVVPDEAKGTGEDWVGALRAEWDDRP